jgi:hypothetical protein
MVPGQDTPPTPAQSLSELNEIAFLPNKFPYQTPPETKHWILWLYPGVLTSDEDVALEIEKRLKELLGHNRYDFIFYENPKMTLPDVYHLQVFWTSW